MFDDTPLPGTPTHACAGIHCQVCHGRADSQAQDAIKRGSRNADPQWVQAATWVLNRLIASRAEFTTDEVMEGIDYVGATTHDARALGGVVQKALRSGRMVEVGMTKSRRRHGARIPVYRGVGA